MKVATGGILLVDKPGGITSHGVVSRVRRAAKTRRVGHAGTLDPMATGLLVLGIDSSTRLLTYLVGLDKEYFATIKLGSTTTTDDAEGETVTVAPSEAVARLTVADIEAEVARLTGTIDQVPSSVSAIKVDGRRAYDRVRAGESVELAARTVTIRVFEILDVRRESETAGSSPAAASPAATTPTSAAPASLELDVRVECTSGTYIRALARDMGAALGVGGHLTVLRRTKVGPLSVDSAVELASIDNIDVRERLLTPAAAATELFDFVQLTSAETRDLMHGKRVESSGDDAAVLAALAPGGTLVGLVKRQGDALRVLMNMPTEEVPS